MAAIGRRDREHPRAGECHSNQGDHRPTGESMAGRLGCWTNGRRSFEFEHQDRRSSMWLPKPWPSHRNIV